MEISERIKRMITAEGLTSSQFADRAGIARSNVSHILSGRSAPGLEALQKMLAAFPRFNAEWLVLDKGPMYKEPRQTSIFEAIAEATGESVDDLTVTEQVNKTEVEESSSVNALSAKRVNVVSSGNQTQAVMSEFVEPSLPIEHKEREIERIVVFYKDHTFTEYINQ
ncbi:MAG: helix-turn-helix domain-containing protein [Salinivirgaceae bacterium]|nr:helix-turn-helix domain-containing protein [Salinivirgaceae bacterium]